VNKCDQPESHRLLEEVREELAGAAMARNGRQCEPLVEATAEAAGDEAGGIPVLGIEARSGRGVEGLLDQLFALDRGRRTPEAQAARAEQRALGELRRRAAADFEQAIERVLGSSTAKEWVTALSRGEIAMDIVVSKVIAAAGDELRRAENDTAHE
jgi:putative protein kinase ArgK-like GTPase of G3E family